MKIKMVQLRQMVREALEIHIAPEGLECMNPEEAYGAGYNAGREYEVESPTVEDAFYPEDVEAREGVWSGGDNLEKSLDHARFETEESNPGPHVMIREGEIKISSASLVSLIRDEIGRVINEAEVIDFPAPSLPWEFGPKGYLNRPELTQKMSDLEYGSDSPPEWILAIALSNRAEEMIGYKQTVDPEPFMHLGMRLHKDYVIGMAGNVAQNLEDITSRIDAGDYFDEDIQDVLGADQPWLQEFRPPTGFDDPDDPFTFKIDTYPPDIESEEEIQAAKTRHLASQQDPGEVGEMGIDFERFLQGIESGDVEEIESEED